MALNENEKAKNSPELLKTLKTFKNGLKEAQNGTE